MRLESMKPVTPEAKKIHYSLKSSRGGYPVELDSIADVIKLTTIILINRESWDAPGIITIKAFR